MAAAYAAVVSLLNTMDQIQIHPRLSPCFENYQFGSLREKVDFFLDFIENFSEAVIREKVDFLEDFVENNSPDADNTEAEDLLRRIAVAAHKAEDIIEIQAADRIRDEKSPCSFLHELQKVFQDMDSIKEKVIKVKQEAEFINSMPLPSSSSSSSSAPLATEKKTSTVVGFDGYIYQLLDELTGHDSGRKIIPIVGMGGIGKTTLVRNVYENSIVIHHFNVRAWVTLSQDFSARKFFLQALSCLGLSTNDKDTASDQQLSLELHKILYNRRYLFVLDDVWSVGAWDRIKHFFPENINGSRIVVTTRESKLVDYLGLSSALAVDFLDDKDSWFLFCHNTFAAQGCPPQLEKVGKKIVEKCKGLPLAIIVIGGLLGKSPRTREYWEKIAKDKSLVLEYSDDEGNKPMSILYLSYKHLPVCLKSCFVYLRLFAEGYRINVPQLVKLWVAEGFIKPNTGLSLEEVAESYIKELVDRNLVLVYDLELNKKLRTCYVHDLVRDLCISIASRESSYLFQRDIDGTRLFIVDERTASFFPQQYSHTSETPSIFHPLTLHLKRVMPFESRLLRVSVCDTVRSGYSLRQVNLRFLSLEFADDELNMMTTYKLPSSISLLWSLQTLVIDIIFTVVAPSEIWEMPQLRHIKIWYVSLPDPPKNNIFVLQNLQTLRRVKNLILTEEVCKRIANIKDFSIHYEFENHGEASSCYYLHNVGCLDKLESLRYSCNGFEYVGDSLQNLKFPSSLKELTLEGCNLDWEMIGSLPRLEVLELLENSVVGQEWNLGVDEVEFICLKHLHIDHCSGLVNWIANSSSFPVLETLSLWFLTKLKEIPLGIGEIGTLERMHIYNCSESATISAIKILEEQEIYHGNESLRLELDFFHETDAEMWREKIQILGFTCQNLQIYGVDGMPLTEEEVLELADMLCEL